MQKRIIDYGYKVGQMTPGKRNKITDVKGVLVGHSTVDDAENKTGVTVILPSLQNTFIHRPVAASYVLNGFGKTVGLMQVDELGEIETPIALTNTLSVGKISDAMTSYVLEECRDVYKRITSVNAVVGETNDGQISKTENKILERKHFDEAVLRAEQDFLEGDVGAGKGTLCFGFKGGIGSASRVFEIEERTYTLGALVQSNFGSTGDLMITGDHVGKEAVDWMGNRSPEDKGSIMVVIATDLPLNSRQLKRVLKRVTIGIARTGSYSGHGSGDVFIGFSTANFRNIREHSKIDGREQILEEEINEAFRAAIESTEEAVLNSMVTANTIQGFDGKTHYSLADFLNENRMEKQE